MRFREFIAFCATGLINLAIGRPVGYHLKTTTSVRRRDLLGLLGAADGTSLSLSPQGVIIATSQIAESITANTGVSYAFPMSTRLGSVPSTSNGPTATGTRSTTGTLTSKATSTTSPNPATVTISSTSYNIGYVSEAPTTPPGELTEWKVIGIAVITITFIGTAILAVAFFDSWWGFLRDSLCGMSRKAGERIGGETLVPDWEKRSWEFRLANEDGHRYPTMNSLESMVSEKEREKTLKFKGNPDVKSAEMAYGGIA